MKFQAIKGVRDILPPESALWNRVEQAARSVFHTYGYGEIRLPIFEPTELFARSVGLDTDIVSKEMYSFEDHDQVDLARLRSSLLLWKIGDQMVTEANAFVSQLRRFQGNFDEALSVGRVPRTPQNKLAIEVISRELDRVERTLVELAELEKSALGSGKDMFFAQQVIEQELPNLQLETWFPAVTRALHQ